MEFNIRTVPLWAIPQLAYIKKNVAGLLFRSFTNFGEGMGTIHVYIQGEGFFHAYLSKQNMNRKGLPNFLPDW